MDISNTHLKPVLISTMNKLCPRCSHHSICHVVEDGNIMSEQVKQVNLVACFISGCLRCARYHGE